MHLVIQSPRRGSADTAGRRGDVGSDLGGRRYRAGPIDGRGGPGDPNKLGVIKGSRSVLGQAVPTSPQRTFVRVALTLGAVVIAAVAVGPELLAALFGVCWLGETRLLIVQELVIVLAINTESICSGSFLADGCNR